MVPTRFQSRAWPGPSGLMQVKVPHQIMTNSKFAGKNVKQPQKSPTFSPETNQPEPGVDPAAGNTDSTATELFAAVSWMAAR